MMRVKRPFWSPDRRYVVLLALVTLLGLAARLWNVDFDQRQHQHPDERFWAITAAELADEPPADRHGTVFGPALDWLDGQRSPAAVYRTTPAFVYGPISLATARATARWLHEGVTTGDQPAHAIAGLLDRIGVPLIDEGGSPRFDNAYQVDLIGRVQGALLDALTVLVIAAIGRRLGGRSAGLCAAVFAACSLGSIQLAHFFGSEPLLGLGAALTVLCALRLDRGPSLRRAASTGVLLGMAVGVSIAAKLTAIGIAAVPMLGCCALLVMHRRRSDLVRVAAMLLGAALGFRVCNPGAFDGLGVRLSSEYLETLRVAASLPTLEAPPSFQWANRLPVLQPLWWLSVFVIGPGAVAAATLGAIALCRGSLRLKRRPARDSRETSGGDATRPHRTRWSRWTRWIVLAAIVVPFAYVELTTFPTSRYFVPMMPALHAVAGLGAALLVRSVLDRRGAARQVALTFAVCIAGATMLWPVGYLHGVLGQEHTRIEASKWIEANIPAGSSLTSEAWDDALPLPLPGIDTQAYRNVQLELVDTDSEVKISTLADRLPSVDYVVESSNRISDSVTRMPARFPSTIRFFEGLDSGALGFQRVATFERRIGVFGWTLPEGTAEEALSVYDHPPVRIWQRVREVDRASLLDALGYDGASGAVAVSPFDATANGLILHDDEVATNADGPTYNQLFDTDGSPWAHAILWFGLLELLGAAGFVLLLPLFRQLPDAGLGVSKVLALVCLASAVFVAGAWFDIPVDRGLVIVLTLLFVGAAAAMAYRQRTELRGVWRDRRATLISVEATCAVLFCAFILLRSANPDLWHPFRGGEKPFELALLTAVLRSRTLPVYDAWFSGGSLNYYYGGYLLLSIPARLARTAPSTVMNLAPALLASTSAGAVFSTGAALISATRRRRRHSRSAQRRAIAAGLAGTAAVLLASNATVLRLQWNALWAQAPIPFDWWIASRVIPESVAITEFPAWSFLFADVHPHVMDIAVLVAIVPVCLSIYRSLADGRAFPAAVSAALAGTLLGFIRMINTWDVPLAAGIVGLTLIAALLHRVSWRPVLAAATTAAAVFAIGFAPYGWRGMVFDSGFVASDLRTPWASWIEHFGFFLAITLILIGAGAFRSGRRPSTVWRSITEAQIAAGASVLIVVGVALLRPDSAVLVSSTVLTLWSCLLAVSAARDRRMRRSPLAPSLLAIGWAIQAAVELFTVRNDGGRMNTVFKFWYQSWIVLSIGGAVAMVELLVRDRPRRRISSRRSATTPAVTRGGSSQAWTRRLALASVTVIVSASIAFWARSIPPRVNERLSTDGRILDGESFLDSGIRFAYDDNVTFEPGDDRFIVEWLRANVAGVRVVAEAPGRDYQWTSRVSWLTGLPTPIGWPYHETQQRRAFASSIEARLADLAKLYTTTDPAEMARILSNYDIEFLVYGTQERRIASAESAAALASFTCLRVGERGVGDDRDLFVAAVDASCVSSLRRSG